MIRARPLETCGLYRNLSPRSMIVLDNINKIHTFSKYPNILSHFWVPYSAFTESGATKTMKTNQMAELKK